MVGYGMGKGMAMGMAMGMVIMTMLSREGGRGSV